MSGLRGLGSVQSKGRLGVDVGLRCGVWVHVCGPWPRSLQTLHVIRWENAVAALVPSGDPTRVCLVLIILRPISLKNFALVER